MKFVFCCVLIFILIAVLQESQAAMKFRRPCPIDCNEYCQTKGKSAGFCAKGSCRCYTSIDD